MKLRQRKLKVADHNADSGIVERPLTNKKRSIDCNSAVQSALTSRNKRTRVGGGYLTSVKYTTSILKDKNNFGQNAEETEMSKTSNNEANKLKKKNIKKKNTESPSKVAEKLVSTFTPNETSNRNLKNKNIEKKHTGSPSDTSPNTITKYFKKGNKNTCLGPESLKLKPRTSPLWAGAMESFKEDCAKQEDPYEFTLAHGAKRKRIRKKTTSQKTGSGKFKRGLLTKKTYCRPKKSIDESNLQYDCEPWISLCMGVKPDRPISPELRIVELETQKESSKSIDPNEQIKKAQNCSMNKSNLIPTATCLETTDSSGIPTKPKNPITIDSSEIPTNSCKPKNPISEILTNLFPIKSTPKVVLDNATKVSDKNPLPQPEIMDFSDPTDQELTSINEKDKKMESQRSPKTQPEVIESIGHFGHPHIELSPIRKSQDCEMDENFDEVGNQLMQELEKKDDNAESQNNEQCKGASTPEDSLFTSFNEYPTMLVDHHMPNLFESPLKISPIKKLSKAEQKVAMRQSFRRKLELDAQTYIEISENESDKDSETELEHLKPKKKKAKSNPIATKEFKTWEKEQSMIFDEISSYDFVIG